MADDEQVIDNPHLRKRSDIMAPATLEQPVQEQTALSFPVQDFDIDALRPAVMALTKPSLDDAKGLKLLQETRMRCVKMRTGIDKTKDEFAAPWLAGHRAVLATAKKLHEELKPLEDHCNKLRDEVEAEKTRIAKEAEDKLYNTRLAQWTEAGGDLTDRAYILTYNDDEWKTRIEQVTAQTAARKAQEEANRIERERLETERVEQERKQAEADQKRRVIQSRLKLMAGFKQYPDESEISDLSDDAFKVVLGDAKAAWDFEEQQKQKAAEVQRKTAERMSQCAAVLYFPVLDTVAAMSDDQFAATLAEATNLHAENERVKAIAKAEQERVDREKAEAERAAREKQIADEAAERSRIETEERMAREASVREQERVAEEARLAREAAMKPAKDKLNAFCITLAQLDRPSIDSFTDGQLKTIINLAITSIGQLAEKLG